MGSAYTHQVESSPGNYLSLRDVVSWCVTSKSHNWPCLLSTISAEWHQHVHHGKHLLWFGVARLLLIKAAFSKLNCLKVCGFIPMHLSCRRIWSLSFLRSMVALIMHKRLNSASLTRLECCFIRRGIDLHYAGWTNSPTAWTSVKVSREGQVSVVFNNKWDSHWAKWSRKSASTLWVMAVWPLMEAVRSREGEKCLPCCKSWDSDHVGLAPR